MASASTKPQINFFRGWPHPSLHPTDALQSATKAVLSNPEISTPALGYGPDEGDETLRKEIAKWLSDFYAPREPVSKERICITGGASQNLACLLQVFSDPVYTQNIWMVAPTYYLACRIFDDAGFAGKLRAVPEDEEGLDIAYLAMEMKSSERAVMDETIHPTMKTPRPWRKIYRHIIYAAPTFSNPASTVMSRHRREQLVELARQCDALIITDDVYDHLQWATSPATTSEQLKTAIEPRLVDIDRYLGEGPKDEFGNVVSNGSFSKLIGAGCRVGWAEGTEKFAWGLSQAGSSRSGGAPSQLTSTFVCQLLSTNFLPGYISNVLRPTYRRRYELLSNAVRKHLLPLGAEWSPPSGGRAGGYFLWIGLPEGLGVKASELAVKAREEENLLLAEGKIFQVERDEGAGNDIDSLETHIRLCFSYEEEDKFEEGVIRLANLIRREMNA